MSSDTPGTPSRRERLRADTIAEIKGSARTQLLDSGPSGVSLRAIARDIGMSPAAIYRYFTSIDELMAQLCVDIYGELQATAEAARDALPSHDYVGRTFAIIRAFRHWAVANPAEFSLIFASNLAGAKCYTFDHPSELPPDQLKIMEASLKFSSMFGPELTAYHQQIKAEGRHRTVNVLFPPLSEGLRTEIRACNQQVKADLPDDLGYLFLSYWVRIYGLIAMEIFGHLPISENIDEYYDAEMKIMALQMGIDPTDLEGR
ncbi:TetR/AcrR family transcriptional regulator [Natronoglycomyces albus]|uniref:TetR/AcrR family transcriptional regulator n=1 Tax=Natronoglycomyces albus TaxID=2811108 RepID=A0A895XR93_9ACTN|nr:TetR/AcrR family transcriptional regulator [Natronoglycomyces albus]QSB06232.1 TetR/AcrR family transcriptional regulator [Natronoglycomyces albus]